MKHFIVKKYKGTIMLGGVFRENKINLLYGESGVGKTISTIKALNKDNIIPMFVVFYFFLLLLNFFIY